MRNVFKLHLLSPFLILGVIEVLILFAALYLGVVISSLGRIQPSLTLSGLLPEAAVFVCVLTLTKYAVGLYHAEYVPDFVQTLIRLAATFVIGFVVLSVIFYVVPSIGIWRSVMAVSLPLGFVGLLISRWIFRLIPLNVIMRRRILVIGSGEQAARIEALEQDTAARFSSVAFVDITGEAPKVSPDRVVARVNSLADFVAEKQIDEIVVAIEERRGRLPTKSLIDCRLAGISISDYQTFCERETGRVDLAALRPDWFVFSDGFPGGRFQQSLKRGLDIAASAMLLVLLLPLLGATAIAIRLESAGPIFYRQDRVGFRGRTFLLTKFRSMRVDAEQNGPQWAARNDSRVTAVGAFIRKTRIDEIPQLFNVLRGDMSFVGPRPERPYFVDQLCEIIPYYEVRHRVKPGITGWAQVNYPYGASIEDAWQKLQFDLYYIKYYSVLRDIVIMLQTFRVIIVPHGAR